MSVIVVLVVCPVCHFAGEIRKELDNGSEGPTPIYRRAVEIPPHRFNDSTGKVWSCVGAGKDVMPIGWTVERKVKVAP
jgi:hypothetical protein